MTLTPAGRVLLRLRRPWRDGTRAIGSEPSALHDAARVTECALEMTAKYGRRRLQFDRPLGSFQTFHQRAADAYINVGAVRLSALEAAWRLSRALPADAHEAVAKFWAAEGGQSAAYACQHLHGGIGIDVDYPLHRHFTWAIQIEHELGSAKHHLDVLGRQIAAAGLPPA